MFFVRPLRKYDQTMTHSRRYPSADLMHATRNICHPQFALVSRGQEQSQSQQSSSNIIIGPNWNGIGSGFTAIEFYHFYIHIQEAVSEMCMYTTQVENYAQGTVHEVSFKQFADDRNAIHHKVLSIPSANEIYLETSSEVLSFSPMYEPCRLALLVYSAAVIFPTPSYTGTYQKLAKRFCDVLNEIDLNVFWSDQPELLLWILVLGGLAATKCVERGFFVSHLANGRDLLNLTSWEEVVEKLKRFLWLGIACDPPGKVLWTEVEYYGASTNNRMIRSERVRVYVP